MSIISTNLDRKQEFPISNGVHFVGIGGIGMSALAQLFKTKGVVVSGSDRSFSPVTDMLEKKGITVLLGHKKEYVSLDTTLLIYSDAVPQDNPERVRARELGIRELSYFQALGEATQEGVSIIISGTHGKTSTTAMIAKILIDAGKEPTVIAGSILKEYGSNFVEGKEDFFVIEGCEYRRHFLNLHPTVLVITNIELDHTDYYHDLRDMQDAFESVIKLVPETGAVITNTNSETIQPVIPSSVLHVMSYQDTVVPELLVPGEFNRENARSAKCAVHYLYPDIPEKGIDTSLKNFTGTWRRFEYKGVSKKGAVIYDDYAHHPTAVSATLAMAKKEFSNKKIVVVFHPHLYSRTKQFFNEFAKALALADETILVPIYAAREALDPTVSSEVLAQAVTEEGGIGRYADSFASVQEMLEEKESDTIIITMGAGDVYQVGDILVQQ
jgi:UDP-N-acetylmuramate--alanine ligase